MKHKHLFFLIAIMAFVGMAFAQNQSVYFDGGDDCITIGNMTSDLGTTYTVEAWFKTDDTDASVTGEPGDATPTGIGQFGRTIFASSTDQSGAEKPMWVSLLGDQLLVRTFANNDPQITYTISGLDTSTWYHIAVSATRSGTTVLYFNGVQVASAASGTQFSWNDEMTIGDIRLDRGLSFWGYIDDVRVWNDIRTGQEINDNYDKPLNGDEEGLVGYWKLDGDALDSTANGYDGTLQYDAEYADGNPTLPVELSSFTAVPNAQYFVELHWTTQSETNVAGFRVYRSENMSLKDAVMFSTFIPATNTSVTQHYMFVDEEIYADGTYYYWLENVDMNGSSQFHGPVIATVIHGEPGAPTIVPTVSGIEKVYPNPFNPSTRIGYMLDKDASVSIKVYNVRGQLMSSLFDGSKEAGFHSVVWNGTTDSGTELPSGIYTVTVKIGSDIHSRRVVLSK